MTRLLPRLWEDEAGQDLTEYALLLMLIALGAVTSLRRLAVPIGNVFNNAASNLTTQVTQRRASDQSRASKFRFSMI